MKANGAPKKIYIACDILTEEGRAFILEKPVSYLKSVEYTRTDAFIEKAEPYLKEQFAKDVSILAGGVVYVNFETAINNFINYMKGE